MDDRLRWDDVALLLDEVKAMARGLLRRERAASLQTTALVLSALTAAAARRPGLA